MALKLFNTMGRKLEEFKPLTEGYCGFYGCGPTVYNYAHIGNLRAYVFLDILDRTLCYLGYKKKHVMNITDIGHLTGDADDGEDKMVKQAKERKQSVLEIADFYTKAFFNDIDRLNIKRPDIVCRATEHVQEMIDLIKQIEANGHTYMAGGNLYYDVTTYPDYGKLANLNLDELKAGAGKRDIVVVDENKRNPYDFVLWFTKSKFEDQALTWDSPWGRGYPGWHIECSAMSMKYLGRHFDIHTGGIDHIPIHHTNEIAQSEGAFSEEDKKQGPWVNYWLHNEFLVIQKDKASAGDSGEETDKMSKSTGNFLTLQVLIDKGYDPLDYRYFLLGAHYRSQAKFSWNSMDSAKNSRKALVKRAAAVFNQSNGKDVADESLSAKAKDYLSKFQSAIENDLATPQALAVMQSCIKDTELKAEETVTLIKKMDSVLGLNLEKSCEEYNKSASGSGASVQSSDDHKDDPQAAEIEDLLKQRAEAKKAKDFAKADEIRNKITSLGITIIDTPAGTTWKRN
jgi:cysteinyl-tRNA synthetase